MSAIVSKRVDNNNLYIIMLNKSLNAENDITITHASSSDKYKVFSAELISAKSPFLNNIKASHPREVTLNPLVVEWDKNNDLTLSMLPKLLVGIKLEKILLLLISGGLQEL